jgi:hypothetical protein
MTFPLWSWPASVALLLLGLTMGWLLLPFLWPMRRESGLPMPVLVLGFMAVTVPSLFFLFVYVLRSVEGLAPPATTWAQWLVFAAGLTAGLWLEERRHHG